MCTSKGTFLHTCGKKTEHGLAYSLQGRSTGDPQPASASYGQPATESGIHEWKCIQLLLRIYSKANLIRVIHVLIYMLTERFLQGTSWLFSPHRTVIIYKQQGALYAKKIAFLLLYIQQRASNQSCKCGWYVFDYVCTDAQMCVHMWAMLVRVYAKRRQHTS